MQHANVLTLSEPCREIPITAEASARRCKARPVLVITNISHTHMLAPGDTDLQRQIRLDDDRHRPSSQHLTHQMHQSRRWADTQDCEVYSHLHPLWTIGSTQVMALLFLATKLLVRARSTQSSLKRLMPKEYFNIF